MLPNVKTAACILAASIALAQTPVDVPVVRSAPFSATAVTESTRELLGGDRVVRRGTALIARDSEGRTRREQAAADGSSPVVFIQDPVGASIYVLNRELRSAARFPMHALDSDSNGEKLRASLASGSANKRESLGIQILEGVVAEGSRFTRTIAAGAAGTTNPIEVVTETWYSDELQVVILNRSLDPRNGEVVYKLINVKRGEPDQSLFVVPDGFKVQDGLQVDLERRKLK